MPASVEQKLKFKELTTPVFLAIENQFTIVPVVPLIQAAHESNWGLSGLSAKEKNIFGMTPGEMWLRAMRKEIPMDDVPKWSKLGAATAYYPTTEHSNFPPNKIRYWDFPGDVAEKREDGKGGSVLIVNRYFRQYANWDESAWDWARKIAQEPRYRFAYEAAKAGDVGNYIDAIGKSGYAKDPRYAEKLLDTWRVVEALPKTV